VTTGQRSDSAASKRRQLLVNKQMLSSRSVGSYSNSGSAVVETDRLMKLILDSIPCRHQNQVCGRDRFPCEFDLGIVSGRRPTSLFHVHLSSPTWVGLTGHQVVTSHNNKNIQLTPVNVLNTEHTRQIGFLIKNIQYSIISLQIFSS
jgi:hypothetical protein